MQKAYTLKIRGGRNGYMKDGKLITAGKGALIQIEKSATLGTSQDQTLFVPVKSICLNDQGGANQIDISIKDRMLNARGASGQLQRAGRL